MKFNRVDIERQFVCGFDLLLTGFVLAVITVAAVVALVGCERTADPHRPPADIPTIEVIQGHEVPPPQ